MKEKKRLCLPVKRWTQSYQIYEENKTKQKEKTKAKFSLSYAIAC